MNVWVIDSLPLGQWHNFINIKRFNAMKAKKLDSFKRNALNKEQMVQVAGGDDLMTMINAMWNATPSGGWSSWHNNGGGQFHGITSGGGAGIYSGGQINWL
jgi:hypothetical protein